MHSAIMIKKTPAFFILKVTNVRPPYLNISPLEVHPPIYTENFPSPLKKLFLKIFRLHKGGTGSHYDWFQQPHKMAF